MRVLLLIVAGICFFGVAIGIPSRINLLGLGLGIVVLSWLVP